MYVHTGILSKTSVTWTHTDCITYCMSLHFFLKRFSFHFSNNDCLISLAFDINVLYDKRNINTDWMEESWLKVKKLF